MGSFNWVFYYIFYITGAFYPIPQQIGFIFMILYQLSPFLVLTRFIWQDILLVLQQNLTFCVAIQVNFTFSRTDKPAK